MVFAPRRGDRILSINYTELVAPANWLQVDPPGPPPSSPGPPHCSLLPISFPSSSSSPRSLLSDQPPHALAQAPVLRGAGGVQAWNTEGRRLLWKEHITEKWRAALPMVLAYGNFGMDLRAAWY